MENRFISSFLIFCLGFVFQSCAAGPGNSSQSQISSSGDDHHRVSFKKKVFEDSDISSLLHEKKGTPFKLLEFDDCTFQKPVRFSPVDGTFLPFTGTCVFRNCTFESGIQGNMTQFLGQLSFGKCRFKQAVNFQNAVFIGPVGFRECTFDGDGMFQNAIFMKESNFMTSHFYGVALFQSARFNEKAQFGNVVFHSGADYSLCRFDEGGAFDYIHMDGNVDFTDARTLSTLSFRLAELKRIQLVNLRSWGLVRFTETSFSDSLVTRGARFFAEPLQITKPKGTFPVKEMN